jgi:hypothetical protein
VDDASLSKPASRVQRLPEKKTDADVPPALKALGGWTSAAWFSASVLSDEEVVGITLPKLAGVRKQTFRLVERTAVSSGTANAIEKTAGRRHSVAARLGPILAAYGASKAAAFGRTKLLFDPPPTLFFAELPNARLKARASNKLRLELIENELRGCILDIGKTRLIAMFWPSSETEITLFVDAALPLQPMHIQFDQAEDARAKALEDGRKVRAPENLAPPARRARDDQPLGARERKRLQSEKDALIREVNDLRAHVEKLQTSQSALGAMEQLGLDEQRLKSMLRLLHPDKHGGSEAANEAAKWINGLRDLLKANAGS